ALCLVLIFKDNCKPLGPRRLSQPGLAHQSPERAPTRGVGTCRLAPAAPEALPAQRDVAGRHYLTKAEIRPDAVACPFVRGSRDREVFERIVPSVGSVGVPMVRIESRSA